MTLISSQIEWQEPARRSGPPPFPITTDLQASYRSKALLGREQCGFAFYDAMTGTAHGSHWIGGQKPSLPHGRRTCESRQKLLCRKFWQAFTQGSSIPTFTRTKANARQETVAALTPSQEAYSGVRVGLRVAAFADVGDEEHKKHAFRRGPMSP